MTPLADLPAGFFHSLIVSRFDALGPQQQTVLKAATGNLIICNVYIMLLFTESATVHFLRFVNKRIAVSVLNVSPKMSSRRAMGTLNPVRDNNNKACTGGNNKGRYL